MTRHVIVGTGAAGIAAAGAIRTADPTAEILLLGDDPDGFYSRPGLAYYLTGEVPEKQLYPFSQKDWKELSIRHVPGRAIRLDPAAHQLETDPGGPLTYDRLLLATGAQAVRLDVPGSDLQGVVKIDGFQDARQIVAAARRAKEAVVVGGGITALELAEGLAARKVRVHYFLRADRFWASILDEVESRLVEARLREEGVQLHYRTELAEILGRRGKVAGVRTGSGETVPCGVLAFAIGIRPRLELAREAGLKVDRGILVDEFLRTSGPHIFAAGDAAQVRDPLSGQFVLDSLWGPAREQGTVAGMNMAGREQAYSKPVAFNVTRLAGLTTTIIGAVGGGRDDDLVSIARGDSETWRSLPNAISAQASESVSHLRLLVGERTLLGALLMGEQKLSRPLQELITSQVDISPVRSQLLQAEAPLGEIIMDFWSGLIR